MASTHAALQRQRKYAYHEAGHVAVGVAVGLPTPLAIQMGRVGDTLARVVWHQKGTVMDIPPQRESDAIRLLAGYVAECGARGWQRVNAPRYCARRSNWLGVRPVPAHALPPGRTQHSDLDHVALLYSGVRHPRPLPDELLTTLWTKTAEIIHTPLVWGAIEDLAREVLARDGIDNDGLQEWLERHSALNRAALDPRTNRLPWCIRAGRAYAFPTQ